MGDTGEAVVEDVNVQAMGPKRWLNSWHRKLSSWAEYAQGIRER